MFQPTRLTFTDARSDKEYSVSLREVDGGLYFVDFAYGKRDAAQKTGTKNKEPLSVEEASKIAEKLIKQKMAKGYVPDTPAAADDNSIASSMALLQSGSQEIIELPQLSNPTTVEELMALLSITQILGQIKKDGERRMLILRAGEVFGTNRNGYRVPVKPDVEADFRALAGQLDVDHLVIDGEDMGWFYAFDILQIGDVDMRGLPFHMRAAKLAEIRNLLANSPISKISVAETFTVTRHNLSQLLAQTEHEEGMVFRRADAAYSVGRPNSGGDSLKIKNVVDSSFHVVDMVKGKRSVHIAVYDSKGTMIPCGKVTIPANANVPSVGDVIDVEYLWVHGFGGGLIQPVYKRDRTGEIPPEDCVESKLSYRDESILKAS